MKRELAGHKRRTKEVALLVRGSSDEDSVFETGARAVAPALPAFLDTDRFADGFT